MSLLNTLRRRRRAAAIPPAPDYVLGSAWLPGAFGFDVFTRTNSNDFESAAVTAGLNAQWLAIADDALSAGKVVIAADTKVGFEVEVLSLAAGGGVTIGTDVLRQFFALQFQSVDTLSPAAARYLEATWSTENGADPVLIVAGPGGYGSVEALARSAAVGVRLGIYLDMTANAGAGSCGWTLAGVDQGQIIANNACFPVGERVVPIVRAFVQIDAGATVSGSIKVRFIYKAADMNGGGMPAGTKDIEGNAV